MSVPENETVQEPITETPNEAVEEPETLLKTKTPATRKGRPRKTEEEKQATYRAKLDRRNARAKVRREAEATLNKLAQRSELPIVADFSATKNNRVDSRIDPTLDPLYEEKLTYERKLLDKKYEIENKRLDLYLNSLQAPKLDPAPIQPDEVKPKKVAPKKQPQPKEPEVSIGDKLFNMYS